MVDGDSPMIDVDMFTVDWTARVVRITIAQASHCTIGYIYELEQQLINREELNSCIVCMLVSVYLITSCSQADFTKASSMVFLRE